MAGLGAMIIVDWQCHFTEHQTHLWRAIEARQDVSVLHVVARTSSKVRKLQGWNEPNLGGVRWKRFGENSNWWHEGKKIIDEHPGAIHVFGGFWADRRFFPLILYAVWRGVKVAVMNEAYACDAVGYLSEDADWLSRLKRLLRPHLYRIAALAIRNLGSFDRFCLLAISSHAVQQFQEAGFWANRIYPFGYFVPRVSGIHREKSCRRKPLRLIFVGSMLKSKGIDILVDAVDRMNERGEGVCLDVYGHGDPSSFIFPGSKGVVYKGRIPFGSAQAVIAQYDALVLPSRHDGWGVVVNEALLQGVPVIVSSNVGAKCLVENNGAGTVFESGNVYSLIRAIRIFKEMPEYKFLQMKDNARNQGERITPDKGAKYFYNILNYCFEKSEEVPQAPW